MKPSERIASDKAEFAEFMLSQKPRKKPSIAQRFLAKILAPYRKVKIRVKSFVWRIKFHFQRHYQLHLTLKHEEKHILANAIFDSQKRREKESQEVQEMFGALPRRLSPLRRKMESARPEPKADLRGFRGEFVKIVREHRGLSREQVCRLLNSHREFSFLAHRYPSYWFKFPFKPEFLKKFEEDTATIIDAGFGGGGFGLMAAAGFPTENFAAWLSKIYLAEEEFAQFREWYEAVTLKQLEKNY